MPARSGPPRILHAPADVGGHAAGLAAAERALGLESDVVVFARGPYGYEADTVFDLAGRPAWQRLRTRTGFLVKAMRSYDVIHFNFGQTLITLRLMGHVLNELPLIKRAGITILVTFQGCDVRPQACCSCARASCRGEDPYRRPNARRLLRYADRSFHLNPDLREWLPGSRFLPYASVDVRGIEPTPPAATGGIVRIAHAPTNRDAKGTWHVIAAVEQLRAEGLPVELDLIEGVSRDAVLARTAAADIVVDQLLIGWYGGFAVEAMALGKPVLCHIREAQADDNPFGAELPIVRAGPDTLAARLRELVAAPERRAQLGSGGRSFVLRRHDPQLIAQQTLGGLVSFPVAAAG